MYGQNYVDYDHKPRLHTSFGAEESSSQVMRTANQETHKSVAPKRLLKNNYADVFVKEFICDQIIQTISFNEEIIYFCFYCDYYLWNLEKVEQHVLSDEHIRRKGVKKYNKGLNKKFVIKSINGKDSEYLSESGKEEMVRKELDRIPNDQKHLYARRGIRLMNVTGEFAYYCKRCETPISSFALIPNHLRSELHQKCENRVNLFNLIRNGRHNIPIVGLQFIIEYNNSSMNEIIYECNFCRLFLNADQMYSHIFDFKHRINVLNNLENSNFEWISEQELNFKLNEWHKKLGMGFVTKTKDKPNMNGTKLSSSMEQLRAIFGSFPPKTCDSIERLFAVTIHNESDAQKVLQIIEAIKDSSVKYYSHKNRQNLNNS